MKDSGVKTMIHTYPSQYICEHRVMEAAMNTLGKIGAIYTIPCEKDTKCPNQPKRSKPEDTLERYKMALGDFTDGKRDLPLCYCTTDTRCSDH